MGRRPKPRSQQTTVGWSARLWLASSHTDRSCTSGRCFWNGLLCRCLSRCCLARRFSPLAHLVTYTVIPLHLRVLWVDVLEVAWVRLLSTCVARSKESSSSVEPGRAVGSSKTENAGVA